MGEQGLQGEVGPQGEQGEAGKDADVIEVAKAAVVAEEFLEYHVETVKSLLAAKFEEEMNEVEAILYA